MDDSRLTQSKEQIQADLNLLDSNTATNGQVLTANGSGGATWQNATSNTFIVTENDDGTVDLTIE